MKGYSRLLGEQTISIDTLEKVWLCKSPFTVEQAERAD